MGSSQGRLYRSGVKPEMAIYLDEHYPGLLEQVMKLAGREPLAASVTASWNSGSASSGDPGADLVTLGESAASYKLHSLLISMRDLSPGAGITVRLYMCINGTEDEVYNQSFLKGTDPDGLWIVNGTLGIHQPLRVEVHSDNPADDGATIDYDCMLEEMG